MTTYNYKNPWDGSAVEIIVRNISRKAQKASEDYYLDYYRNGIQLDWKMPTGGETK